MRTNTVIVLSLVSLVLGCSDASQQAADTSTQAPTTSSATNGFTPMRPEKNYNDPREAVNDFLIAVSSGDNAKATSLLTVKSQQELWSNGLEVFDAGLPGSSFQVTEVEQRSDTEVHVETVWVDESQNSYPCVWLLRKEAHGWSIFGMATKFLPHVNPIVLPFEDQQELARRKAEAGRIMQQYEQQQRAAQQQAMNSPAQGQLQPAAGNAMRQDGRVRQASRNVEVR